MKGKLFLFLFISFLGSSVYSAVYYDGAQVSSNNVISSNITNSSSGTLCFWINPNSVGANGGGGVVGFGIKSGPSEQFIVFSYSRFGNATRTNYMSIYFYDYTKIPAIRYVACTATSSVNPSIWTHVAYVHSQIAPYTRIYLNGVNQTLEFTSNSDQDEWFKSIPVVNVSIGARTRYLPSAPFFDNFYKGYVDDVRYYNRILTNSEIESLGQSRTRIQITDNLCAWWKLDEGNESIPSGVPGLDVSGNGNSVKVSASTPTFKASTYLSYPSY